MVMTLYAGHYVLIGTIAAAMGLMFALIRNNAAFGIQILNDYKLHCIKVGGCIII